MATVFLSYAREDADRVRPLAAALEKLGHTVWWDEQVAGGDQFTHAIQDALDKADVVIVAWSKSSVRSAWVRDEAAHGRDSGKLVPVTIDGSLPPLGFREYQSIDLSSWGGRRSKQIDPLGKAVEAKAGRKKSKPRGKSSDVAATQSPSRRLWPIAAAVAVAAGAGALGLVASGLVDTPLTAPRERSPAIAVLPFADLSPARDKAYFAEGIAEEILSTLAAEQGIRVLGRTSARQIGRDGDPGELRKRLGITHLLEGSARSAGDQLRVNVRLIDTSDGSQLWEEEYQGRPADVFAVQDQIAGAVVQRLRGTLSPGKVRAATPTDAVTYQTYLAARALMRSRTSTGLQEALALAKKVAGRDPDYAPNHALLAELYYLLSNDLGAYGSMPLEEARKLGIPHAKQAIRYAPGLADGYGALGLHLDPPQSLVAQRRAVALEPSRGDFRNWLGFALNEVGRHDEALAQYRAGAEIDPLAYPPVIRFVHALSAAGEQQQAIRVIHQYVARGGVEALQHPMLVNVATWQADPSAVIAHGQRTLARETVRHQAQRLFLAAALHALGRGQEASQALLPMQNLYAPYYRGDLKQLRRNIASRGIGLWDRVDRPFAFVHLAKIRDWSALIELYDNRPFPFDQFCAQHMDDSVPLILALRAQGRAKEAQRVFNCLGRRLALELRNKARSPFGWPGDLEFRRAGFGAVKGDSEDALRWLDRAVSLGWLGQPYSSRLSDYPQFDAIRSDRRYAELQRRVDAKIARERAELAAGR